MRNQIAQGSRAIVYINGRRFGRAISLDFSSSTPTRSIDTIDNVFPEEIATTRTKIRGSLACYRLIGDGGIEGIGISTSFDLLPRQRYFSVEVRDRVTDLVIFHADYCRVEEQSWSLRSKELMTGSFSFTGITWGNETSGGRTQAAVGLP